MSTLKLLREIPRVDDLMIAIQNKIEIKLSHEEIKSVINGYLSELRDMIKGNELNHLDTQTILEAIEVRVKALQAPKFVPLINGTGVVIHTNLGRSTISKEILLHATDVLCQYNNLEFDLEAGTRGTRYAIVESLLCTITGAEAAIVVNNNAAAVMLVLNTLAKGKEVIVSRGELVEIGGAFRIPDVMSMSGCVLKEVGTTNKTHYADYEDAISDETALLLKVHTSNYKILGFTQAIDSTSLSELAHKHQLPVYEDLGSGLLVDLMPYGFTKEPLVQEVVKNKVDVISFSGDKLLGASQCGIIVGKKEFIDQMKKNQLLRALRIDKFSLAILEQTLLEYLDPAKAVENIDTLRRLTMTEADVLNHINQFWRLLESCVSDKAKLHSIFKIRPVDSEVGGGSYPLEKMKSYGLYIKTNKPSAMQDKFRKYLTPIITRIIEDEVVLDFRTISQSDFTCLVDAIKEIVNWSES